MADDKSYGSPTAGGVGFSWDNPWVKYGTIAAAGLLLYWLWRRRQGQNQAPAITATDQATPYVDPNTGLPTQAFAVNPLTGVPINPATGQDFGQIGSASSDLGAWTTKALAAAKAAGISPLAANNALYNFLNNVGLTTQQQGILDTVLGSVGQPPGGPYQETLLPPPPEKPPAAKLPDWINKPFRPGVPLPGGGGTVLTPMQQFVNSVYAYLHRNTKTYTGPVFTKTQIAQATTDVKTGKAYLPVGFNAPTGYVLNPTTRILTKAS